MERGLIKYSKLKTGSRVYEACVKARQALDQGNEERAERKLKEVLENPGTENIVDVKAMLVVTYKRMGEEDKASEHFGAGLTGGTSRFVALAQEEMGRLEEALELYRKNGEDEGVTRVLCKMAERTETTEDRLKGYRRAARSSGRGKWRAEALRGMVSEVG